jgi:transcriptional regulator with XRE-family HTH domain
LTQRELARAAGVSKATISAYERGRQPIGPENLSTLLDALEVAPRAWEATVRHVTWVDHLSTGDSDVLEAEALRLAESVARDFELSVSALLRLMLTLSGREERSP